MAFNLKVYQVRGYPFQHPNKARLTDIEPEMRASCDEQYTDHKESNLDKEAMKEEVHRQFLRIKPVKKLDIL